MSEAIRGGAFRKIDAEEAAALKASGRAEPCGAELPSWPGVWVRTATGFYCIVYPNSADELVATTQSGQRIYVEQLPRGNWHPAPATEAAELQARAFKAESDAASSQRINARARKDFEDSKAKWLGMLESMTDTLATLTARLAAAEREREALREVLREERRKRWNDMSFVPGQQMTKAEYDAQTDAIIGDDITTDRDPPFAEALRLVREAVKRLADAVE